MEKAPAPPPYPGPNPSTNEDPKQSAMYPPPPVYSAAVVQPPPSAVVQPPPSAVVHPAVTVVQPQAVVRQQPNVMLVSPVVLQPLMTDIPARVKCSFCQQEIVTSTRPVNGLLTWTVFGVLFLFLIWPCCLIPFCVTSCQDVEHRCPNCNNILHIYKRM